jgi:hypothetical protein
VDVAGHAMDVSGQDMNGDVHAMIVSVERSNGAGVSSNVSSHDLDSDVHALIVSDHDMSVSDHA